MEASVFVLGWGQEGHAMRDGHGRGWSAVSDVYGNGGGAVGMHRGHGWGQWKHGHEAAPYRLSDCEWPWIGTGGRTSGWRGEGGPQGAE